MISYFPSEIFFRLLGYGLDFLRVLANYAFEKNKTFANKLILLRRIIEILIRKINKKIRKFRSVKISEKDIWTMIQVKTALITS